MKNPFLIGKQIYLRPIEEDDIRTCQKWINDPAITKNITSYLPFNERQERKWFENLYEDDTDLALAVVIKENDKYIGNTSLHKIDHKNRNAEFGILIGEKEEWDKGYGTETAHLMLKYGFDTLNLHRISLLAFEYNSRALNVYHKVGFVKEGTLREAYFQDGKYHDIIVMGLLRVEWEANAGQQIAGEHK